MIYDMPTINVLLHLVHLECHIYFFNVCVLFYHGMYWTSSMLIKNIIITITIIIVIM